MAIRRRQGNAMSHLGMAEGHAKRSGMWSPPSAWAAGNLGRAESIAGSEEGIVTGGSMSGKKGYIQGQPNLSSYGTAAIGKAGPPLASDNNAFASGVSAAREIEPNKGKPKLSEGEARGARLTVSPSMKMPSESPVPTQGGGHPVPSISSRLGSFGAGQSDSYGG
jgi:hypothetical protein